MFTYFWPLLKAANRRIHSLGGIVMKLVISLLSVILVLIVLGTLFGALSDMFSAYLNDLLTVGLGV